MATPFEESSRSSDLRSSSVFEFRSIPQSKPVPPYLKRLCFFPRKPEDFGDGGAFPEFHFSQFPLDMVGRKEIDKFTLPLVPPAEAIVDEEAIVVEEAIVDDGPGWNTPTMTEEERQIARESRRLFRYRETVRSLREMSGQDQEMMNMPEKKMRKQDHDCVDEAKIRVRFLKLSQADNQARFLKLSQAYQEERSLVQKQIRWWGSNAQKAKGKHTS